MHFAHRRQHAFLHKHLAAWQLLWRALQELLTREELSHYNSYYFYVQPANSPGKYLCRVTSIASKRSNPNQTTKQPTSFVPWDIFNPSKQSGEVRFRESRSGTGTEWGNLEHAWTSKTVLAFNDFQHWDLHPELVRKEHKSSWLKHLDFCMVRAVACNCTSDGRWFRSTYHTWVPALIILGHCLRDTFSTKSGQKPTQSGKQPVHLRMSPFQENGKLKLI